MSLFSKIKSAIGGRKKEKPKKAEPKPKKEKRQKPEAAKTVIKSTPAPVKPAPKKRISADAYRILREPHISEKATYLSDENKYIFKVFKNANKIEIKNAVSSLYGVRVKDVKTINIKSKSRKMRNVSGHKPGYKKAIVILEEGQKIEILPH